MWKAKASDLGLRQEIVDAFRRERAFIDAEIRGLREAKRELRRMESKARQIGKMAYLAMNSKNGAKRLAIAEGRGHQLTTEIAALRGWRAYPRHELSLRHTDLWVGIKEPGYAA